METSKGNKMNQSKSQSITSRLFIATTVIAALAGSTFVTENAFAITGKKAIEKRFEGKKGKELREEARRYTREIRSAGSKFFSAFGTRVESAVNEIRAINHLYRLI